MDPEIEALKRQVHALRRQMTVMDHWHNTMKSRWYKRLWWWVQGYRLMALGTWYRAPWNSRKYD